MSHVSTEDIRLNSTSQILYDYALYYSTPIGKLQGFRSLRVSRYKYCLFFINVCKLLFKGRISFTHTVYIWSNFIKIAAYNVDIFCMFRQHRV